MSIFDRFNLQFGSQFRQGSLGQSVFSQNSAPTGFGPARRPQTMAEWQTYVDGLSRFERDQLWPGMHRDLIPAIEMIDAQLNVPQPQTGFGNPQPEAFGSTTNSSRRSPVSPSPYSSSSNPFGALKENLSGQTAIGQIAGQKSPQSLSEWKTLIDDMPRHERDKL